MFPVDASGRPTEDHIPTLIDLFRDPSQPPHNDLRHTALVHPRGLINTDLRGKGNFHKI
jgi:hypothetical protein